MKHGNITEKDKWHRATCMEDVLIYAICGFKSFWDAGKVNSETSNLVKQSLGLKISGYKITMTSEGMRHIFKGHFSESRKTQKNVGIADLKKILQVVNKSKEVCFGDTKRRIYFKTKLPKGLYHFIVDVDDKNKRLLGKTMWIGA